MASCSDYRWISPPDDLWLVSPDDARNGKGCFLDHAAAVKRIQTKVGFSRATIKFYPKRQHEASLHIDENGGQTWGCSRISGIELRTRPGRDDENPPGIVWARRGDIAWRREARLYKEPTIEESIEKLANVIKDGLVLGTFEFEDFKGSGIPCCVAPILGKALTQTPLVVLKFSRQHFSRQHAVTSEVAAMIAHLLVCSKTLSSLELNGCDFYKASSDSLRMVADGVRGSRLRTLSFSSHTDIRASSFLADLIQSMVGHPTLEHLRISGHAFHTEDATSVATLLKAETCRLKKLDVSDDCTDAETSKVGIIDLLIDALALNRTITRLDLSNVASRNETDTYTGVSLEQMKALASALCLNNTLEELVLENSGISEEGIIAFASKLPKMQHLRKLDLRRNECGPLAADALRCAMENGNTSLRSLAFQKGQFDGPCCTPPSYFYDCKDECHQAIDLQLALNRGGRYLTTNMNDASAS